MIAAIRRIWRRRAAPATDAKQRLKAVLVQDRLDLTPARMDRLRAALVEAARRYVRIDDCDVHVELVERGERVVLVTDLPIQQVAGARARLT